MLGGILGASGGAAVSGTIYVLTAVAQGKPVTLGGVAVSLSFGAFLGAVGGSVGALAGPVGELATSRIASAGYQLFSESLGWTAGKAFEFLVPIPFSVGAEVGRASMEGRSLTGGQIVLGIVIGLVGTGVGNYVAPEWGGMPIYEPVMNEAIGEAFSYETLEFGMSVVADYQSAWGSLYRG